MRSLLVTALLLGFTFQADPLARYRDLSALVHSQRPVELLLTYDGLQKFETEDEIARGFRFLSEAGSKLYVLGQGSFQERSNYTLEIVLLGFARDGKPYARLLRDSGENRYQGDIREEDLRIREIKSAIERDENLPAELRLRYSRAVGDYLAFYDLEGQEIYYRYREDRFDRKADRIREGLFSGQAYLVAGELLGLSLASEFIPRADTRFRELLTKNESVLTYRFSGARPLRIEQILF
ncbi:MAG: hypothetical protein HS115_00585 [Spirochaetales bacterium]|nr:hypothetical protein [Spirochaetales bacterium]